MYEMYEDVGMIISEKQIMQLMYFASEFRKELLRYSSTNILSEDGKNQLERVNTILTNIYNQQSEELKVIE